MLDPNVLIRGMEAIGRQWNFQFTELHESSWYGVLRQLDNAEFLQVVDRCLLLSPKTTQMPTPRDILALARPTPSFRLPAATSPPATPDQISAVLQTLRIRRHERPNPIPSHPVFGGGQPTS